MVEVVTSWQVLMRLARAVGDAEKEGSPEKLAIAQAELEAYEEIVRKSDRMSLNLANGDLSTPRKSTL